MKGSKLETAYSIPATEDIRRWVVRNSSFRSKVHAGFWEYGRNLIYRLRVGRRDYFLKIFRTAHRSHGQLVAQAEMLYRLGEEGVPVVLPVPCTSGDLVSRIRLSEGVSSALIYPAALGKEVAVPSVAQSKALGKLWAKVHTTADSCQKPPGLFKVDEKELIARPYQLVQSRISVENNRRYFKRSVERLKGFLLGLPRNAPAYGFIHGDTHGGNVRFGKEAELTIFDFDCSGIGWRAYDFATFVWDLITEEQNQAQIRRLWKSFLKGYNTVRKVERRELGWASRFLQARHIFFMGWRAQCLPLFGEGFFGEGYFDQEVGRLRKISDLRL